MVPHDTLAYAATPFLRAARQGPKGRAPFSLPLRPFDILPHDVISPNARDATRRLGVVAAELRRSARRRRGIGSQERLAGLNHGNAGDVK